MNTLPDRLLACPCGKVPTALSITCDDRGKWGTVAGDCCSEWSVEFRNQYERVPSDECTAKATAAWNEAPRAAAALSGREADAEQLRVQLAGCGVLAMCNTRESLEAQRIKPGDYGWSASLGEVIAAAEREIALREQLATTPQPGDGWRPIAEAPLNDRIVVAYFGPETQRYGTASVGYFFKWDGMEHRGLTGWGCREKPTHWMPLPAAPSAKGVA